MLDVRCQMLALQLERSGILQGWMLDVSVAKLREVVGFARWFVAQHRDWRYWDDGQLKYIHNEFQLLTADYQMLAYRQAGLSPLFVDYLNWLLANFILFLKDKIKIEKNRLINTQNKTNY